MQLQDFYPFNSTILGLNNQYISYGSGRFYINLDNVFAKRKVICTGDTYLFLTDVKNDLFALHVELIDVYHDGDNLNIMLEDNNKRIITIKHNFNKNQNAQWWLLDLKHLKSVEDKLDVIEYCRGH